SSPHRRARRTTETLRAVRRGPIGRRTGGRLKAEKEPVVARGARRSSTREKRECHLQSVHQLASRNAAASALPRQTENREAVDRKVAQRQGRRSAPLGCRAAKARSPGNDTPSDFPRRRGVPFRDRARPTRREQRTSCAARGACRTL